MIKAGGASIRLDIADSRRAKIQANANLQPTNGHGSDADRGAWREVATTLGRAVRAAAERERHARFRAERMAWPEHDQRARFQSLAKCCCMTLAEHATERTRLLSMALVTAAILVYEIALTRLLSVVLWYHFAFLSISLAMLGLGAPGVWFALRQRGRAGKPALAPATFGPRTGERCHLASSSVRRGARWGLAADLGPAILPTATSAMPAAAATPRVGGMAPRRPAGASTAR